MATNFTKELMVKPGKKVKLEKFDPNETLGWGKNHTMKASLDKAIKKLDHLQYLLYANRKHALLVVFQGRDAAGKDGTIRHVMSGVNPQGCTVTAFKARRRKRLRTITCGACTRRCRDMAISESSTARITRMC